MLASVPARSRVDADQAVDPRGLGFLCPSPRCDIVVHDPSDRVHFLDDPIRVPESGNKEADALLEGDVDPFPHSIFVNLRRLLDQCVEPDRFRGQLANSANAFSEFVSMDKLHRDGLDDPDASGLRYSGDELWVGAGIHGAADEREHGPPHEPITTTNRARSAGAAPA